jgi:hypothetical protein
MHRRDREREGNQKCHVFLVMFYVFYSTKLENKRTEQVLHRVRGQVGGGRGSGPNNVYTCK